MKSSKCARETWCGGTPLPSTPAGFLAQWPQTEPGFVLTGSLRDGASRRGPQPHSSRSGLGTWLLTPGLVPFAITPAASGLLCRTGPLPNGMLQYLPIHNSTIVGGSLWRLWLWRLWPVSSGASAPRVMWTFIPAPCSSWVCKSMFL